MSKRISVFLVLCLMVQTILFAADGGARYTLRQLPSLEQHIYDAAFAINDAGVTAGVSNGAAVTWAFNAEKPKLCYKPGKDRAVEITAVNDSGIMAGKEINTDTGEISAITIDAMGTLKKLGGSGRRPAEAFAINDTGTVVGYIRDIAGNSKAMLWKPGTESKELPMPAGAVRGEAKDINNAGRIVGYCGISAIIWEADGSIKELPTPENYIRGVAYGINNKDGVVGEAIDKDGKIHAFCWKIGKPPVEMEKLPGYDESRAEDINDTGYIAGWLRNEKNETRAVIWNTDGNILDLGTITPNVFTQAFAINKSGYVVGTTRSTGGQIHAVMWSPTKGN